LTHREIEVLQMIVMEMTNDQIAKKLFVAKRTTDTHRQNLISRRHAKNIVAWLKLYIK